MRLVRYTFLYQFLYTQVVSQPRPHVPVEFVGRALDELRDFPAAARQAAGWDIDQVQRGLTPATAKPMPQVGRGCWEIRVAEDDSWFRVFYVATFGDIVYVLHAFQKQSNETPRSAIDTGQKRYRIAQALADEEES